MVKIDVHGSVRFPAEERVGRDGVFPFGLKAPVEGLVHTSYASFNIATSTNLVQWEVSEGVGVCQRVLESVNVCQRVSESVRECRRVSESVGECQRVSESVGECQRVSESVRVCEELQRHNSNQSGKYMYYILH